MRLSQAAKDRLAAWIKEYCKAEGISERELGRRLGLSGAPSNWKRGQKNDEIRHTSIEALARVRKEPIALTIEWLGGTIGSTLPAAFDRDMALALLRVASVEEKLWLAQSCLSALSLGVDRGVTLTGTVTSKGESMCFFGQFVRLQLQEVKFDLQAPSNFDRFAFLSGFFSSEPDGQDRRERLRDILSGQTLPTRGEIELIFFALEEVRGQSYSGLEVAMTLAFCQ